MHPRQTMMLRSRFSLFTLGPGECGRIKLIDQSGPRLYETTKGEGRSEKDKRIARHYGMK